MPEQMFVTPDNPGEAVSAVKALQKAAAQGQRIYHITQANMATALPNIHHDQNTMDEIRNALAMGKEVITHTDAFSVTGWTGAGYVLMDQDTGAAAWKIGGGLNGGALQLLDGLIEIGKFLLTGVLVLAAVVVAFVLVVAILTIIGALLILLAEIVAAAVASLAAVFALLAAGLTADILLGLLSGLAFIISLSREIQLFIWIVSLLVTICSNYCHVSSRDELEPNTVYA